MFPSIIVRRKIAELPQATHTPTDLKGKPSEEIAKIFLAFAKSQVLVCLYRAKSDEQECIRRGAELARQNGKKVVLIEDDRDGLICKIIAYEIFDARRERFFDFLDKIVIGKMHLAVTEFNQFVMGDERSKIATELNQLHYWQNIGLDGANNQKERVEFYDFMRLVPGGQRKYIFERRIIPQLLAHPNITNPEDLTQAICLGMLSNAARGLFYRLQNVRQTYEPRLIAINHYYRD